MNPITPIPPHFGWRPIIHLFLVALALIILGVVLARPSQADETDGYQFRLAVDQSTDADEGAVYRREHHERTIAVMLYGFNPSTPPLDPKPSILKDRKALSGFFKNHWENVKRDYLGQTEANRFKVIAGDEAFTSQALNRGINTEPAKMVGATLPIGHFTFGAGYTWDEENPALMLKTTEGLMVGISYDNGDKGYQLSYLSSGQEVVGLEIGGTDIRYDSLMFGTSWRVNESVGLTATAQYRKDNDPLTTDETQGIFTVGTRWKF